VVDTVCREYRKGSVSSTSGEKKRTGRKGAFARFGRSLRTLNARSLIDAIRYPQGLRAAEAGKARLAKLN
jgi:hypothetical protein